MVFILGATSDAKMIELDIAVKSFMDSNRVLPTSEFRKHLDFSKSPISDLKVKDSFMTFVGSDSTKAAE